MKTFAFCVCFIAYMFIVVVGCNEEKESDEISRKNPDNSSGNNYADGLITEEVGGVSDYIGWWKLIDNSKVAPFAYIEIPEDDPYQVNCYDKEGNIIDTGYFDYSEQREVTGLPLIIFKFETIGEYGWHTYYGDGLTSVYDEKLDGSLTRIEASEVPN